MNHERISKKQDCRGDSQDRYKRVCKVHTKGGRGRYQEQPNFKRAFQAKGVIMPLHFEFIYAVCSGCGHNIKHPEDARILNNKYYCPGCYELEKKKPYVQMELFK